MPLMQWNDRMSMGLETFDNEHKKLVEMINELFDGMQAGKGAEALGKILDKLIDYTKVHFAHEEKLMAEHGYADSPTHKAEHVALAKQVLDVQAKFKSGASAVLSMDVLNFLKEWLLKHIQGTDKKYVAHFKSKGVK